MLHSDPLFPTARSVKTLSDMYSLHKPFEQNLDIHVTARERYFSECSTEISEGIKNLGHHVTLSEGPPSRSVDINFVIGMHLFPKLKGKNCRLLAGIQTEQLPLVSHCKGAGRLERNLARFNAVKGNYDIIYEWNPSLFAACIGGNRFLPYGCRQQDFLYHEKRYDIAFIGNIHHSPRRQELLHELQNYFSFFPDFSPGFGREKEEAIHSARVLLNIHHYDSVGLEAPRMFDYLALGACVLSEWSPNTFPFTPGKEFEVFESKQDLFDKLRSLLVDSDRRLHLAEAGHKKSQMFTYDRVAEFLTLDFCHCLRLPRHSIPRAFRRWSSSLRTLWFDTKDNLSLMKSRFQQGSSPEE